MKKLLCVLVIAVITISCKGNENKSADSLAVKSSKIDQKQLKRYQVKSGIIHYSSTLSGKIFGNTMSGSGTESVYFKDWGAIELRDEKSTETSHIKMFGTNKKEITKKHVMNKLDNGEWYTVDFENRQINARRSIPIDLITAFHPDSDAGDSGKQMITGLGGKKIGEEKFMGYTCEIWEAMGSKQWVYKHITLKIENTIMGITTTKQATSIEFDISVPAKYFELPDYPVVEEASFFGNADFEMDMDEMDADMEKVSKLSFEEWKKLALSDKDDEEMKNMSEEELRQTYDMIQKMVKMRKGN